jgi:hypothetical protein
MNKNCTGERGPELENEEDYGEPLERIADALEMIAFSLCMIDDEQPTLLSEIVALKNLLQHLPGVQ